MSSYGWWNPGQSKPPSGRKPDPVGRPPANSGDPTSFYYPPTGEYYDYRTGTYYNPVTGETLHCTPGAYFDPRTGEFFDSPFARDGNFLHDGKVYDHMGNFITDGMPTPKTPPEPPPPDPAEKQTPPEPPKAKHTPVERTLFPDYVCPNCGCEYFGGYIPKTCACKQNLMLYCAKCKIHYPRHCKVCPCCRKTPEQAAKEDYDEWRERVEKGRKEREAQKEREQPQPQQYQPPPQVPQPYPPQPPAPQQYQPPPRVPKKKLPLFPILGIGVLIVIGIIGGPRLFGGANSIAGEWVKETYADDYSECMSAYMEFKRDGTYWGGATPEFAEKYGWDRKQTSMLGLMYFPYEVKGNTVTLITNPLNGYGMDFEYRIEDGKLYWKNLDYGDEPDVYVRYKGKGW